MIVAVIVTEILTAAVIITAPVAGAVVVVAWSHAEIVRLVNGRGDDVERP